VRFEVKRDRWQLAHEGGMVVGSPANCLSRARGKLHPRAGVLLSPFAYHNASDSFPVSCLRPLQRRVSLSPQRSAGRGSRRAPELTAACENVFAVSEKHGLQDPTQSAANRAASPGM